MADNTLRVGAEFDVSQIVSGAATATAAYERLTKALIESSQADAIVASMVKLVKEYQGEEVVTVDVLSAALKRQAEAAAELATAKAALKDVTQATEGATRSYGSAVSAARVEMGAFLGSTGMMASGLARVAAQSALLKPIIEAAFPAFAVIAFVEVLKMVFAGYDHLIEAVAGWDAAAKKAYEDQIRLNNQMILQNAELTNKVRDLNQIGSEGLKKLGLESKDNTENMRTLGEATAVLSRELNTQTAAIQERNSALHLALAYLTFNTEYLDQTKEMTAQTAALKTEIDGMVHKLQEMQQVDAARIAKETAAEGAKQVRDNKAAEFKAEEDYANTLYDYEKSEYARRYALGEITLEQETAGLKASLEARLKAEEDYYSRKRALLLEEGRTGKNVTPEVTALDEGIAAKRATTTAALDKLDADQKLGVLRRTKETTDAEIAADALILESKQKLAEAQGRFDRAHADSVKEAEEGAKRQADAETAAVDAQIEAYRRRADVLKGGLTPEEAPKAAIGTDAFSQELGSIKENKPQIYAELLDLNAKIIAAQNDLATKLAGIESERDEKIQSIRKAQISDQLALETESNNRILSATKSADDARLKMHQETNGDWIRNEQAALNAWHTMQLEAYNAALKALEEAGLKETEDYQKIRNKMLEIDRDFEDKSRVIVQQGEERKQQVFQQVESKITSELNSGLNSWLEGNKRFGQAMAEVWDKMVISLADAVAKMAVQEALALVTHKKAAVDAILVDAKSAAAAAFHWVMEEVPFPVNVGLAPAVAAATFAAVVAFASFEKGGIVQGTPGSAVPIMAHAGEGVMPAHLTSFLLNAASSVTNNKPVTTNTFNNQANVTVHQRGGRMTPGEITAAVRRGMRMGY